MMKVRLTLTIAVLGCATSLSGCVSIGNTHALITPVGVAGVHTFKPAPNDHDINLPAQRDPNRMAANRQRAERASTSKENET